MMRIHSRPRGRWGTIARRLAIVALAVLVVGCTDSGDDDDGGGPNADASAACTKLADCDQCFSNQTGQCITTAACAQRLGDDVAICINAVDGCSPDLLGDCVFPGCDGIDPTGECS